MKITITGTTVNPKTRIHDVVSKERIYVNTEGSVGIYSEGYIIDKIISSKKEGIIGTPCTDIDLWQHYKSSSDRYNKEFIDLRTLEFEIGLSLHVADHSSLIKISKIQVTPQTTEELNQYFSEYLKLMYNETSINGVLVLPKWDMFTEDLGYIVNIGDYITSYACSERTGKMILRGFEEELDHYYVIHKSNFNMESIDVHAPGNIVKHMLGKYKRKLSKSEKIIGDYIGHAIKLHIIEHE